MQLTSNQNLKSRPYISPDDRPIRRCFSDNENLAFPWIDPSVDTSILSWPMKICNLPRSTNQKTRPILKIYNLPDNLYQWESSISSVRPIRSFSWPMRLENISSETDRKIFSTNENQASAWLDKWKDETGWWQAERKKGHHRTAGLTNFGKLTWDKTTINWHV